jgi:hypothetical protein
MSSVDYSHDSRGVMTLEAREIDFRFSAMGGNRQVTKPIAMPSEGNDLKRYLDKITEGFTRVKVICPALPVAIFFLPFPVQRIIRTASSVILVIKQRKLNAISH